jgi:hypothetical protein
MPRKPFNMIAMIAVGLVAGSSLAQDRHENHSHAFPKDVDAFHATLAPLWHAQAGKQRSANVCAQAGKLESLASEIRKVDTKALVASVTALKAQCNASPTNIDTAFSDVHDAFHRVMGQAH